MASLNYHARAGGRVDESESDSSDSQESPGDGVGRNARPRGQPFSSPLRRPLPPKPLPLPRRPTASSAPVRRNAPLRPNNPPLSHTHSDSSSDADPDETTASPASSTVQRHTARAPAHHARMPAVNCYSSSSDLSRVSKLASKCSVQQLRKILAHYEVKGMSKMRKETLVRNGIEVYQSLDDADRRQLVEAMSDPTGKERAVSSTVQGNPASRASARGKKRKAVDVWTKPRQPHRYGYIPEEDEDEDEDGEEGEDSNTSGSRATSGRNGEAAASNNAGSSYDSEANDSTFVPSETSDDSSEHSAEIMPPSFLNPSEQYQTHSKSRRPKSTVNVISPSPSASPSSNTNPSSHSSSSRPRIMLTLPKSVVIGQSKPTNLASPASAVGVLSPASPSPSPAQPLSSGSAATNAFVYSRGNTFPLNQPMRINTGTPGTSSGQSSIRPYVPRGNPAATPTAVTVQQYWSVTGGMPQSPAEPRNKRAPDPVNNSPGNYSPISPSSYGIGPPLGSNARSFTLPPANLPGPYTPSAQGTAGTNSRSGSSRQYADYLEFSQYLPEQGSSARGSSSSSNSSTPHLFGMPIMTAEYPVMGMDNAQRMYPSSNHRSNAVASNSDFDLSQYLIPTSQPQRTPSNNSMANPQRPRFSTPFQSPLARDPAVMAHGRAVVQPASAYPQAPPQPARLTVTQPGLNANSIMANNPFAEVFAASASERTEEKVVTGPGGAQELRFGVVKPSLQAKAFAVDSGGNHGNVIKAPVFHQTLANVTPPLSIRRDPSLTTRGVYREIITTFFFDHSRTMTDDQHMVLMRFCQENLQRPCHETHPDNLKLMLNGKTLVEPSVVDFSNRMKKKKNTVYSQPIEVPLSLIAAQNVVLVRWTEDTGQGLGPGGAQLPDEPPKDYFLVVEYARRKTMEEILHIVQSQRVDLADTVYKLYQTLSGSDDDIVTDSQKISLHCPASRLRLGLPVRGRHCDHVDCFDANSFLFMNKAQKARWTCPKCNKAVHFDEIVVDEFLQTLLDAFPNSESIEATLEKEQIVVREACKPAEPESSEMGSASASSCSSRPSGSGSTSGNAAASSSSGASSSSRSAAARAAVEIITLD